MLVHIHNNLLPCIVNNVGYSLIKAITYLLNCFRFYCLEADKAIKRTMRGHYKKLVSELPTI